MPFASLRKSSEQNIVLLQIQAAKFYKMDLYFVFETSYISLTWGILYLMMPPVSLTICAVSWPLIKSFLVTENT